MRIIPNSTITLYSGVQIDNNEQLIFSSIANQAAYFATKSVMTVQDCQYVKKTGRINITVSGSVISTCNYLSFINPSFDNKVFYCRIIDYDFINNETCSISWVIDYWQTYMFDVSFDDMHIERQHLSVTDFNKAETNPYDPSIYAFRTPETALPIGEDLEKLTYTLGSNTDSDGFYVRQAISDFSHISDACGALMYLAEIDFEDLDDSAEAGATKPSEIFVGVIEDILNGTGVDTGDLDMGFYMLTESQYNYLHGLYPSRITQQIYWAPGWNTIGLAPFNDNVISPGYTCLYISTGASAGDGKAVLTGLISALTQWSAVSAIIGLYGIPNNVMAMHGTTAGTHNVLAATQKTVKTKLNVHNKKLMHYPFSYLRLITPTDVKELHFENFTAVQNGNDACEIAFNLDILEKPTLIIAPNGYKFSGMSPMTAGLDANMLQAMIMTQFPSMPYTTDSFLTALSAAAMNQIQRNTTDYGYSLEQKQLDVYRTAASAAASTIAAANDAVHLDLGGAATNAVNATFGATQAELSQKRLQNEANMSQDAYGILAGEQKQNAIYENMKNTRPAYAVNKYSPAGNDGTLNYNIMSFFDVIVLRVTLNPTILEQYDKWLSAYGLNFSGMVGIPYVLKFINHQESSWDDTIHWETINGRECTYVKTADCKCLYSMLPVSGYIKAMFDGGIRLYKGDLS